MTIDNAEPTTLLVNVPEGWTPIGSAYAALATAQADMIKAAFQLREANTEEALSIVAEAKAQLVLVEQILNPRWML